MSRQLDSASDAASSVGGASDAGSEAGKSEAGSQGEDHGNDLLKESKFSLKAAVFDIVYSLKKLQLDHDLRLGVPTLFLEFLQWLILIFGPEWDWDIDWTNSWWRFYSRWQLQRAVAQRSHLVFLVVFYLMIAVVAFILGVCVYIHMLTKARKQPRWKWPLTAFRILVFLVFTTFQTSFLLLFTVPWTCPIIGERVNKRLLYFPSIECTKGANLIHACVGIAMSLLFVLISLILAIADGSDLNPHSKALYASPCGTWTFRRAIIKSALPLLAAALPNYIHMRAWLYFLMLVYNYWVQVRHVPYYHTWINCAFAFSSCTYAWGAFLLLVATYVRDHWDRFTIAFYCGAVLSITSMGLVGFRLKFIRFFANRMGSWTSELTPSQQHHFRDDFEAELCARVSRKTTIDEDLLIRVPHPQAVSLAETILKAGIHQYPQSEFLLIVQTGLRIHLKNEKPGAALAKAKSMAPSLTEQYQIFKLEQGEVERMAHENSDNTMDMASYAEFQRQFKSLKEAHKAVLFAFRAFWQALVKHDVTYVALVNHFKKVEELQLRAERGYRQGLLMYPKNPALLRSYAEFMQDIKLNPNASMRYWVEADKLEAQQTESRKESMLTRIDAAAMDAETVQMVSIIDEEKDAHIIINTEGLIQFANKGVANVFGWSKAEVEGKNISMLMPPPYSQMHNGLLRAYNDTGNSNIINRTRELQGLHMDRYSFPIKLAVTKMAQTGADGFMGVIKPIHDDANIAMVYVTPAGIIVSVGRGFNNLFGHDIADHIGKPLRGICKEPEEFNKLLSSAVASTAVSGLARAASNVDGQDYGNLTIMHKYGDEITVQVKIMKAGVGAAKTVMMTMIPVDYHTCFVAISQHAKILYANESMANLLGRKVTEISKKMSLPQLLTIPCQQLHQNFFKGKDTSKIAGLSCRSGRVVLAGDRNYNPVPITMILKEHEDDTRGKIWTARIAAATPEQQVAWHTMHVIIDNHGIIFKARSDPALFGVKTEELMGQSVAFCIDYFRAIIERGGNMADGIKAFLKEAKDSRQQVWRIGICPKGRRTIPGLMKVQFMEDDKYGLLIFHAENLDGVIELDNGCVIKAVRETAALMFGVSVKEMVGRDLAEFIPRGCPSNNAEDLLIVGGASTKKGGLGAKKKTVGKLMPLDAKHADGSTIAMIGQAAKHPDKPRVLLRLRLFRPTSPTERTSSMAASMSREAKLLQNVLPIEQTPTGVPANPGRPLIDFATELPPPAALAAPAGGYGGPGSKQPQSIKQALEASDQMFAAKEREGNKLLTPRTSRSTRDEATAAVFADTSKASLGAPVSGQGEQAASVVKRAYSTASALLKIQRHGAASPAMDVQALAEAMPPSATAYEGIAPPVKTIAEDTPYAVPATMSAGASEQLDLELGSHHGSQQGSAAASSFEGQELDEDEAAAAADFTPMTEEKRLFVNEWIAKLGEGLPDEQDPVEDTGLEQEANDAAARVAGVGGDREDRGLLAAAAQDDEGEGGAVNVLDSASAAGDAPEGGDVSSGADFARAKRHKKLSARLNSSAARSRMTWLKRHSVYVLLFLLVTHTGGFIATRVLLGDLKAHVASVTATGVITSGVLRLATLAREAQISGSLYGGNGTSMPVRIRSQAACATSMLSRIAILTTNQRQLYLEIGESDGDVKNRLESLYNTASLNITVYQETTPPRRVYRQIGLWDAGNSFIAAARGVSDLPIIYRYNFTQMAQWNFMIDNAATLATAYTVSLDLQTASAQESSNLLLLVDIILLVVEGAFVIPLALAYMSWVRRACAVDRASLYSIFLRVPRPTVVAIAKAEVKLVGEDADDDDDPPANADQKEEEEGKWAATKGMQYSARGRSLTYSRKAIVVFIMPLIAWLALIILNYGLAYMFINNSQPRLDSVNGGSRVQSSTFAMRFFANEMVYASTPISLAGARRGLNVTSNILRTWHERLLFGSSTEEVAAGSIQYQAHGALPVYRSTPRVQQVYFSDGCLRAPASTCLNSSNPYYPMTNHGLNVLTYYYMDQADNLANEVEEDVLNSNPHYAFIQAVALSDLEVAQTAVQAELENYTIQPTASEQIMQIVVFVVMFVGAGIYFMWYVKPFLSQYAQERKRAAMMLSQLPADIDIAMLLQPEVPTASGATPQKAKKGNAISPSSGFKSVRVD